MFNQLKQFMFFHKLVWNNGTLHDMLNLDGQHEVSSMPRTMANKYIFPFLCPNCEVTKINLKITSFCFFKCGPF